MGRTSSVTMPFTFPFGRPVTRRPPSATSFRRVLILGAYPSALHVEWCPPPPVEPPELGSVTVWTTSVTHFLPWRTAGASQGAQTNLVSGTMWGTFTLGALALSGEVVLATVATSELGADAMR